MNALMINQLACCEWRDMKRAQRCAVENKKNAA
jgi:hypothetical protein